MKKSNTPSFTISLRLNTTNIDEAVLYKRFNIATHIYNVMVKEARKRVHRMFRDDEYKDVMKYYHLNKKFKSGDKSKLSDIRKYYGLSEYQFHSYLDKGQSQFKDNIDSFTRQKIGSAVWQSVSDYLFDNGDSINFKKKSDLKSFEGKSNATGIKYRNNHLDWNGLYVPCIIKNNDKYIYDNLEKHKIKYCRITRRWHKHKYRYYLQLVMEGYPEKDNQLNMTDNRTVGIDIGPSTVAVVSEDKVMLKELVADITKIDKKLAKLQRKLDRQRRVNNPNNYNTDGTIRRQSKNFKRVWKVSHRQQLTEDAIKSLYIKRSNQRKQSHEILANEILKDYGTDIYIENMNMNGLKRKVKETKISETTGKYCKKKRFGKSVDNHAPSMLINILNRKLSYIGKQICKVDTYSIKASQLNHITGEYIKVDLSTRWKQLNDDNKVQRDLYSAFILMNCDTQTTVDFNKCFGTYDDFKIKHDILINELKENKKAGTKYPACMGI